MASLGDYTKDIDKDLSVHLEYVSKNETEVECLLTFHNKLTQPMVINSTDTQKNTNGPNGSNGDTNGANGGNKGWFSGIWGGGDESEGLVNSQEGEIHLFLGYLQLFGYVALNYSFALDDRSNMVTLDKAPRNSAWWVNNEYLDGYTDGGEDPYDRNDLLYSVPFVYDNVQSPMVVGGKLGGVNDLVLEDDNNAKLTIDLNQRYFVQDLIYDFNSYKQPQPEQVNNEGKLPLKELTDSLIPFYSTSQSLLFSDLSLAPKSHKSYRFTFPNVVDSPPTYNANLTGITGEQGLISIRYLVILGFLKLDEENKLAPISVYYPFNVVGDRKGRDDRWLQSNYLQHVTIDKSWKINLLKTTATDRKSSILENNRQNLESDDDRIEDIEENKKMFLEDLDNLIKSDLHNIPKISSKDRKKSISSVYDPDDSKEGLIPQLPHHMKNQFQILVNSNRLCLLKVSKPYYHIGEDLVFNVQLYNHITEKNKYPDRAVGLSVHIEAHEIFHTDSTKKYTNIYKVTPDAKFNSFASSMLESHGKDSFINGYLNIPNFITQQFQCSKLMDLKYFVVFKFNLYAFDKETVDEETINGESNETNGTNGTNGSTEVKQELQDLHLDEKGTANNNSDGLESHGTRDLYQFINNYKFHNVGTDFRFRLPIAVLP